MKRVLLIALISLMMIGLFAANGTLLLAKSSPTSIGSSEAAAETMGTASQLYEAGYHLQAAQAYQQVVDLNPGSPLADRARLEAQKISHLF